MAMPFFETLYNNSPHTIILPLLGSFAISSIVASYQRIVIQLTVMKKKTATNEKPLPDLKTFVENINKKDKKRNGLKIRFAFTNRKRKG